MMKTISMLTIALLIAGLAGAQQGPRVLYLTKSSGFEHSVVKRPDDGGLSHSETIMTEIVTGMGGTIVCTKDASEINAENLKNFDVIAFYTTGVLTQDSKDGGKNMGPNGCQELLDWITAGHGFFGVHAANDTFHSDGATISPFVEMIGGEFDTHGAQFKGKLNIVSPNHPALGAFPDGFSTLEEWYISKNLNTAKMHVLALLDPGRARIHQPDKYNVPSYPIVWCRAYGQGRVLYNALGHREEVWSDGVFKQLIKDNLTWCNGKGDLQADPNYDAVVPKTIEPAPADKK